MKQPYFFETSLPIRVQKYMEDNEYVDIEEMTDYMIKTYKEFSSKKKKIFIKSVSKAHKWELYNNLKANKNKEKDDDSFFVLDYGSNPSPDVEILQKESQAPFSIDAMYNKSSVPMNENRKSQKLQNGQDEASLNKKFKRKRKEADDISITNSIIKKRKKFVSAVPNASLNDIKGIMSLNEVACLLAVNLLPDKPKYEAPNSVLITGPEGSGKTMFVTCLAGTVGATLLQVPANELISGPGVNGESLVKEAFKEALSLAPCILLIENLHTLGSKEYGYPKSPDKKICDQIQASIAELETKYKDQKVLVIGETRNLQHVDLNLQTKFERNIFMPPLDKDSRISVLQSLCPKLGSNFDFAEIGVLTSSFVAGDLKDLVLRARDISWKRTVLEKFGVDAFALPVKFIADYSKSCIDQSLEMKPCDFLEALSLVTPTLKKEGFPSVPDTTWDDVGGLKDIKNELAEKILSPMQFGELHDRYGAKKPNGIMLWGPPGCGKTLLAKAVANHAGVNLYAVMGPELLNMYQGESERAIREVFKRAASVAPCVIFFDEFDCICPRRTGSSESGSKMTIVNTLLTEMSGFSQRKDVFVMAATNRPDMVDPAVLRPERFDTSLFVGLPDQKGRVFILNACTKNRTKPKLDSDVCLEEIGSWCEDFSGADCAQLVYMASKTAIAEDIEKGKTSSKEIGILYRRHFEAAIKRVSSSVGPEEQRKYLRMKAKFERSRKEGSQVILHDTQEPSCAPEEKEK